MRESSFEASDRAPARRLRRAASLLGALALLASVVLYLLSQMMVRPPRPRVSDSERPVLGVVVHDGADGGGAVVVRVLEPARSAGVRDGDRIVGLAGEAVHDAEGLAEIVQGKSDGEMVEVRVMREGESLAIAAPVVVRPVSPADLGLVFEEVSFVNARGRRLRGWYVAPPPGAELPAAAVAFGHGNGTDRRHFLGVAWHVHQAGLAQLLFDFAGRGESDGDTIALGALEADDLHAALDTLASRPEIDPERLALVGRSMGAVAAILCAADRPELRALVLDSPFAELTPVVDDLLRQRFLPPAIVRPLLYRVVGWRAGYDPAALRPVDAIARVRAPILLWHGTDDQLIPIEHAHRLQEAATSPLTVHPIENAGHNTPRTGDYPESTAAFLRAGTHRPVM